MHRWQPIKDTKFMRCIDCKKVRKMIPLVPKKYEEKKIQEHVVFASKVCPCVVKLVINS